MRLILLIAILAFPRLALSGAEAQSEKLVREQFPGFSLSLPEGEVTSSVKHAYSGRHEVRLAKPSLMDQLNPLKHRVSEPRVVVSWTQHGMGAEEWYQQLRGTLLKTIPGNPEVLMERTDGDKQIVIIGASGTPVGYGTRSCERGFNIDVVVGVSSDAAEQFELTRQIVDSTKCQLTDANRRVQEAATRLPRDFFRIMGQTTPTYATLAGDLLIINFTAGDVLRDLETFQDITLASISQSMGIPIADLKATSLPVKQEVGRKTSLTHVVFSDSAAYVGALWCPKIEVTFMAIYIGDAPSESRARTLLASVGCPGDPSEPSGDARPVFERACNSGDSSACEALRVFAF